jgi:hypothetical protein
MPYSLQESLNLAVAKDTTKPQRGEAYVDWAIEALCQGEQSENIAILAGFRAPLHRMEIIEYLERILDEKNLILITEKQAVCLGLKQIALQIISGDLSPEDGCDQLDTFHTSMDYPEELSSLHYFIEDYGFEARGEHYRLWTHQNSTRADIDAAVIAEAQALLLRLSEIS